VVRSTLCAVGVMLTVLFSSAPASAQSAVDTALSFYSKGGAYCFRVAPFGVALSEEREWTVMVLTSAANHHNTFRIRTVDAGGETTDSTATRRSQAASASVSPRINTRDLGV